MNMEVVDIAVPGAICRFVAVAFYRVFTECGCTWQSFHLDAHLLQCPFLQPIGLVDYKSLKKSISFH